MLANLVGRKNTIKRIEQDWHQPIILQSNNQSIKFTFILNQRGLRFYLPLVMHFYIRIEVYTTANFFQQKAFKDETIWL